MIRELRKVDINKVAEIWLDTNIKTHYFISAQYWKSNFELVKELLLQATVYVYEDKQEIQGFIGLSSVCSLSNLFFRFHTTTLTEACSNELKQHHL